MVEFSVTLGVPWPLSKVLVDPNHPTPSDVVDITLSGHWWNSCVPVGSEVFVTGNHIYFDVIAEDPNLSCLTEITPWQQTQTLGPLAAGAYTVHARLLGDPYIPETYAPVAEFDVTGYGSRGRYNFVPDQSSVHLSGGIAGDVNEPLAIEGQFDLSVDLEATTASLTRVDAVISDSNYMPAEADMDELFGMTTMVGTIISNTAIGFETNGPPGEMSGDIVLTFDNGTVHMAGHFWDGAYDGIFYDIDANAVAAPVGDLTGDGNVDLADFAAFVPHWENTGCGVCGGTDFSGDGNVGIDDLAEFCRNWLTPPPGITYEVGSCDHSVSLGGESSEELVSAGESGQRFSVWVDGSYIHFEDLIRWSCGMERVWLEMEVVNNVITIREHAEGNPAWCKCYYPASATLGPFTPGDYVVEVYGEYGEFIGSQAVTVGP